MKITSAHAIAFLALFAAVSGGFAVAHDGDTDKIHLCISNADQGNVRAVPPDATCAPGETTQDVRTQNVAYHVRRGPSTTYRPGKARLVSPPLIVPGNGDRYVISGKLVVRKSRGDRTGLVTCRLASTDNTPADVVRATVRRGESVPMAFQNTGKTDGRPGQTAVTDISCSARNSAFSVSAVQLTAVPVNVVSGGVTS